MMNNRVKWDEILILSQSIYSRRKMIQGLKLLCYSVALPRHYHEGPLAFTETLHPPTIPKSVIFMGVYAILPERGAKMGSKRWWLSSDFQKVPTAALTTADLCNPQASKQAIHPQYTSTLQKVVQFLQVLLLLLCQCFNVFYVLACLLAMPIQREKTDFATKFKFPFMDPKGRPSLSGPWNENSL